MSECFFDLESSLDDDEPRLELLHWGAGARGVTLAVYDTLPFCLYFDSVIIKI